MSADEFIGLDWCQVNRSVTILFPSLLYFKYYPQLISLEFKLGEADDVPDIVLDHNESERFECRFSTVRIENSKAMMLRGMSDSVLGVWVAHGEGEFICMFDHTIKFPETVSNHSTEII